MSKKLIIISVLLIVLGLVISVGALALTQFNFDELTGRVSKTYDIEGEFDNIECDLGVANINILLSNDNKNSALCLETDRSQFEFEVVNNTLKVKEIYKKVWIGISTQADVTLFLSKDIYNKLIINGSTGEVSISDAFKFKNCDIDISTGDIEFMAQVEENLNIKLSTGDTSIYKVNTTNLNIECSTGRVLIQETNIADSLYLKRSTGKSILENITIGNKLTVNGTTGDLNIDKLTAKDAKIKLSTGDCNLTDFVISGDLNLETSTGDVRLNSCDAANMEIKTDTGSVKGTILTNKIFDVNSDTGKISHPDTYTGGMCKITTDTGSVIIEYK